MICTTAGEFLACIASIKILPGHRIRISPQTAAALKISAEHNVRYALLRPSHPSEKEEASHESD
jgi:hypothetical protein